MKGNLFHSKYRILHTLGKSKFSETFVAQDIQTMSRRKYVIKKFRPILGNSQAKEIKSLFIQESKILQRLDNHPQIPQLYESFMDGKDFYLVREWVKGITLEQHVQQHGVFSESEARQILDSILQLLKYIHSHGMVYHQLKPSSILLRQENRLKQLGKKDLLPVPIYFGGVRDLDNQQSQSSFTNTAIGGYKEYISPEQKRGESFYTNDLYSLGLTIIFLLTGKTPRALKSNSFNNKLFWREEAPKLTTNLGRVLERAISHAPKERFASAEGMLQALNSQPVVISEVVINKLPKEPILTPEIKITSLLCAVSFSAMGIFFGLLNFDFNQFDLGANEEEAKTTAKMDEIPQSFRESPPETKSLKTVNHVSNLADDRSKNTARMDEMTEKSKGLHLSTKPMKSVNQIPAFTVGDEVGKIFSTLGAPTMESKGYWGNSRAVSYFNYAPDMYALGYLSDVNTSEIRQTEVTFVNSAELKTIHQTVENLMSDDYVPEIEELISQVFYRNSPMQEFTSGDLAGIVQRNSQNGIYIGIWDYEFH